MINSSTEINPLICSVVVSSGKVVIGEGLGWERDYIMCGENTRNYVQYFLTLGCLPFAHVF